MSKWGRKRREIEKILDGHPNMTGVDLAKKVGCHYTYANEVKKDYLSRLNKTDTTKPLVVKLDAEPEPEHPKEKPIIDPAILVRNMVRNMTIRETIDMIQFGEYDMDYHDLLCSHLRTLIEKVHMLMRERDQKIINRDRQIDALEREMKHIVTKYVEPAIRDQESKDAKVRKELMKT